jgi:hypothetical protein
MRGVGLLVVAILLGALVGWELLRGDPPERPEAAHATEEPERAELEELREILEAEIKARIALADEVARLREELAAPDSGSWREEEEPEARREAADEAAAQAEEVPASRHAPHQQPAEERPTFDEAALLASGVEPHDVARLRELWEEVEMDKLYLNDRAAREGWLFSKRHRRQTRALQRTLREELDEESYDLLLFATGRSNRVVVREVLDRSPARSAGLEPGDVIFSYDGARVFNVGELRSSTAGGSEGETVRLEVLRKGELVGLYAQRGPLGVYLRAEKHSPGGG